MKSSINRNWACLLALLSAITLMTAAQAQDVQVNSANPNAAEQGTFDLDVEIAGSGFDSSAQVDFYLAGTSDPGGIAVKKVKVRGSKKIIATIDVDSEAVTAEFDIEVSLSSSRRGRGTTLFSVIKKSSSGNNTVESLRLTFRNAIGDRLSSDPIVNADTMTSMLCSAADSPDAQYWVAAPLGGFVDANCQDIKDLAAMGPGLTGSVGLWFTTHLGGVDLPAELPTSNRWLVLDFSGGIDTDIDGDGDLDPSVCPNIDAVEYIHPDTADPDIQDLVPPIDPDPCIDNLQGLFRAGSNIFDMPQFLIVNGGNLQVRIPIVQQVNKRRRVFGIDPAYHLTWDSMVVTDAGDANSVTLTCGNDLMVAGHTCRATLTKGGASRGSRYPDQELIGVYKMPFSLEIQRVFCNADGTGCAVP